MLVYTGILVLGFNGATGSWKDGTVRFGAVLMMSQQKSSERMFLFFRCRTGSVCRDTISLRPTYRPPFEGLSRNFEMFWFLRDFIAFCCLRHT